MNTAHKNLIRRYLVWAYKSTKESFDRLERKTTQLMADEHILKSLSKQPLKGFRKDKEYQILAGDFKTYIAKKKEIPVSAGQYQYLKDRLDAVEGTIKHFLGAAELKKIQQGYEAEFTRRIWEAKDH